MKRKSNPQQKADEWNEKVGVGETVEYRDYPGAEPQRFTTRTRAEVLSGHTAVVWLEGKAGCVCVDACRKVRGVRTPQKTGETVAATTESPTNLSKKHQTETGV